MVAVETITLTLEENAVIARLRWLRRHYSNFKLSIYGQGSPKRIILDMEWAPRIRLTQETLSLAVDD